MEWVETYPGDTQAQAVLRDILTRLDQMEADAPLEDWSWDGEGEAELPRAWLVDNWLPANRKPCCPDHLAAARPSWRCSSPRP